MNFPLDLYEKLRALPALIRRAEARVNDLDHLGITLEGFVRTLRRPSPVEQTLVYVLPPKSIMMAQATTVELGKHVWLSFMPPLPLEAGSWIVAVGPARVRTVTVGNQCQSSLDYHGQVCQTKDEAPLGVYLRVELVGG